MDAFKSSIKRVIKTRDVENLDLNLINLLLTYVSYLCHSSYALSYIKIGVPKKCKNKLIMPARSIGSN